MKFHKYPVLFALYTILISQPPVHAQANVQTFWQDYPSCEEACHESVYTSQQCTIENDCDCSGCLCLADSCLCETSAWLIAVAQCIGQICGAGGVTTAASIAQSACNENGFSLAVASSALMSYGLAAIPKPTEAATTSAAGANTPVTEASQGPSSSAPLSSTTLSTSTAPSSNSATQTSSSPASGSSAASNGGSSLSTAALVGSIVGSVTGAIASIAGVLFAWKSYKKKEKSKEVYAGQSNLAGS